VFRIARAYAVTGSKYHRLTYGVDGHHFDLFRRCYEFVMTLPEAIVRFGDRPQLDAKTGWDWIDSFDTPPHFLGKFIKLSIVISPFYFFFFSPTGYRSNGSNGIKTYSEDYKLLEFMATPFEIERLHQADVAASNAVVAEEGA
jgi:hypothetical protein